MLAQAEAESPAAAAENWLARFESALTGPDTASLKALLHPDSYWRDVLALTWSIDTFEGRDAILNELPAHIARAKPSGFRIARQRTAPRRVTRAGTGALEAIFTFETAQGRGSGVLRLSPDKSDSGTLKAWTLLTTMQELKGFEERKGRARDKGVDHVITRERKTWLERRRETEETLGYSEQPYVVIIGGGQGGIGLGLRYNTGIGPIRLDVGAPLGGDTGNGVQLYVGIGQAF